MFFRFVREEWRKVLATFLVCGFFLFFWINGPIDSSEPILNLDSQESAFSTPKLVGEKANHETHGSVGEMETHGHGHALILDDSSHTNTGIIQDEIETALADGEIEKQISSHIQNLFPSTSYTLHSSPVLYATINSEPKQFYFESKYLVQGVHGYGGPINAGLVINEDGEITSVAHISSNETESYLLDIVRHGYYEQFEGKELSGGHLIDAVSGATLTSQAIAQNISLMIPKLEEELLANITTHSSTAPFKITAELSLMWILHIAVIFIMFLYGIQKRWRKSKRGMLILAIASLVYIGFFLNNSFTYITFIHPFLGTSVSAMLGIYAFLCLMGAVWGKNTYCKYVCPFGNAQRLILRISPNKLTKKFPLKNKWIVRVRAGIAMVLMVGVLLGLRSWGNFELFPDLFGWRSLSLWTILALLSVFITMRYPMIWCRLLCPTGSILDGISSVVEPSKKRAA